MTRYALAYDGEPVTGPNYASATEAALVAAILEPFFPEPARLRVIPAAAPVLTPESVR